MICQIFLYVFFRDTKKRTNVFIENTKYKHDIFFSKIYLYFVSLLADKVNMFKKISIPEYDMTTNTVFFFAQVTGDFENFNTKYKKIYAIKNAIEGCMFFEQEIFPKRRLIHEETGYFLDCRCVRDIILDVNHVASINLLYPLEILKFTDNGENIINEMKHLNFLKKKYYSNKTCNNNNVDVDVDNNNNNNSFCYIQEAHKQPSFIQMTTFNNFDRYNCLIENPHMISKNYLDYINFVKTQQNNDCNEMSPNSFLYLPQTEQEKQKFLGEYYNYNMLNTNKIPTSFYNQKKNQDNNVSATTTTNFYNYYNKDYTEHSTQMPANQPQNIRAHHRIQKDFTQQYTEIPKKSKRSKIKKIKYRKKLKENKPKDLKTNIEPDYIEPEYIDSEIESDSDVENDVNPKKIKKKNKTSKISNVPNVPSYMSAPEMYLDDKLDTSLPVISPSFTFSRKNTRSSTPIISIDKKQSELKNVDDDLDNNPKFLMDDTDDGNDYNDINKPGNNKHNYINSTNDVQKKIDNITQYNSDNTSHKRIESPVQTVPNN